MKHIRNKSTPKVVGGRVQKKHNHILTPNYWNTYQKIPQIDRENPGKGFKHVLSKRDLVSFIEILPDWEELSSGLDAILLSTARGGATDGWYNLGVIGICAWPKDLWHSLDVPYFMEHRAIFDRLGIPYKKNQNGYLCQFTAKTVKAYQLLHILLHELGHHHDRMNTKSQLQAVRGENYAEMYSIKYEKLIWLNYAELFGF